MHFVRTDNSEAAAQKLASTISALLGQGKQVVWFVSGGSAVSIAVSARKMLMQTDGLIVVQVDERYGPVGHPDSNWQQLLDAGFVTDGVTCYPILTGKDLETTVADYDQLLVTSLQSADYRIGLFGMGADGHTAGILPHSVAADVKDQLVASYQGPDYLRITTTAPAIMQVDLAVLYAAGESKLPALQNLQKDLPVTEQPAQLLKRIPELWIYNDQIGEQT